MWPVLETFPLNLQKFSPSAASNSELRYQHLDMGLWNLKILTNMFVLGWRARFHFTEKETKAQSS